MISRTPKRQIVLLMVALCAGALTSDTARAQGTIVFHDPADHVIISRGSPTVLHDVDLDGNGAVDFTFRAGSSFHIFSETGNRSAGIPQGGLDFGSFSIPLEAGFSVSPSLLSPLEWRSSFQPGFPPDYWVGQTLHYADSSGTFGYWHPNMTAYLGVEFAIDGANHYGWIRLSTWFLPGVNGGTIQDWAYNSIPGQPIFAGQVPEPATWLLIAAGGLVAFFAKRRPTPAVDRPHVAVSRSCGENVPTTLAPGLR